MNEVPTKEISTESKPAVSSASGGTQGRTRQFEIAYPEILKACELGLLGKRQETPGVQGEPKVGFGLSGGGIRSATFCLGLFQSLARKNLLNKIDYLSSVSGGGFFASFYGRLFSRDDVKSFQDIRDILSPNQNRQLSFTTELKDGSWKSGVFRWLRENGRYLAPNGSGDLLTGITVFLRNWLTVQLIVSVSLLAVFLFAQTIRITFWPTDDLIKGGWLWWSPYIYVALIMGLLWVVPLGWAYWTFGLPGLGETNQPPLSQIARMRERTKGLASTSAVYSFALQGAIVLTTFTAVLAPVAYLARQRLGGTLALDVLCVLVALTFTWWQFALLRATHSRKLWSTVLFTAGTIAGANFLYRALTSNAFWLWGIPTAAIFIAFWFVTLPTTRLDAVNYSEKSRSLLTQWLRTSFFLTLGVFGFALIDSVGQSFYAESFHSLHSPWSFAAGFFGVVSSVVPFARSILTLRSPTKKNAHPSVSLKLIAGAGATVVILPYLVLLNILSHAISYDFAQPCDGPAYCQRAPKVTPTCPQDQKIAKQSVSNTKTTCRCGSAATPVSWTPSLSAISAGVVADFMRAVELTQKGFSTLVATLERSTHPVRAGKYLVGRLYKWVRVGSTCGERNLRLTVFVLALAVFFSTITGLGERSFSVFLNRTSLHALYCGRLIRAYLGASNKDRYGDSAGVSDPVDGDDIAQEEYWRPKDSFWEKGAPLHLVNVTINETVDGRSQTEERDRRGVGMAIGPAGFSVGVQHHVVFKEDTQERVDGEFKPVGIRPINDGFSVFYMKKSPDVFRGQALSLGNWAAISGAAVSTGLGGIGSMGTSLLTGFFNVRLGYWWDSGTNSITPRSSTGPRPSRWLGKVFSQVFPVQSSLIDEFLGRFHGTLRRYWNLSDGGHFENLAGYELIRRRLALIVIIDAGADPNYDFSDLANLIRKARLDFNAEIKFFGVGGVGPDKEYAKFVSAMDFVETHLGRLNESLIGSIDQLRRGKWSSEPVPERERFFKSNEESRLSLRHAALAKITYLDDPTKVSYLLLIKPTLIGEEPQDLINYHSAHPAFPQESTAEQFFNEAQWESYRRLGQHIGEQLFG